MRKFMDKDFLLNSKTAEKLYFDYAEKMPIIDYHCHVSPQEIYEDKQFKNIFEIWLSGDHYKWRLMRSNGVDEYYITGDAPQREKFQKFAEALEKSIGNPMYHWCHLELKKYLGYEGILNADTAEEVWQLSERVLAKTSVRQIIKESNVAFIGTTDEPIDSLIWHKKLMEDKSFDVVVAPTFRPDKALNIEKDGWADYIKKLEEVAEIKIDSVSALKKALAKRIDYFDAVACRASDHGMDYLAFERLPEQELDLLLNDVLSGKKPTKKQADAFRSELLLFCAAEYKKRDWVMQLHYNCLRNPNTKMFAKLGVDMGFDSIRPNQDSAFALKEILDALFATDTLPKTVIYSLDGNDNAFIDCIIGAFQGSEVAGKLQHGSAWWFYDTKLGMEAQLKSLASLSILGNFIGMLTDSRSFLSYTRHEYFRRILCNVIGQWVEDGEYPDDFEALGKIVEGVCFNNAKKYFNL